MGFFFSLDEANFFFSKNNFCLFFSNDKNLGFHMRYHFFLHYGWFLQNLGKEAVQTNMHTTVHTSKTNKSYKCEVRHLFQCCILIPRKCPRKTPLEHTVPPWIFRPSYTTLKCIKSYIHLIHLQFIQLHISVNAIGNG